MWAMMMACLFDDVNTPESEVLTDMVRFDVQSGIGPDVSFCSSPHKPIQNRYDSAATAFVVLEEKVRAFTMAWKCIFENTGQSKATTRASPLLP